MNQYPRTGADLARENAERAAQREAARRRQARRRERERQQTASGVAAGDAQSHPAPEADKTRRTRRSRSQQQEGTSDVRVRQEEDDNVHDGSAAQGSSGGPSAGDAVDPNQGHTEQEEVEGSREGGVG